MIDKEPLNRYVRDIIEEYEAYGTPATSMIVNEMQRLLTNISDGKFDEHSNN